MSDLDHSRSLASAQCAPYLSHGGFKNEFFVCKCNVESVCITFFTFFELHLYATLSAFDDSNPISACKRVHFSTVVRFGFTPGSVVPGLGGVGVRFHEGHPVVDRRGLPAQPRPLKMLTTPSPRKIHKKEALRSSSSFPPRLSDRLCC